MSADIPDAARPLADWSPRPWPPATPMQGRFCRLVPLDPDAHAAALFDGYAEDASGQGWTWLPYGPFPDAATFRDWTAGIAGQADPQFLTICDAAGRPSGVASYLRVKPRHGTVEVGHIHYAPRLQRTTAATEAMVLMMRRVFDGLGYRRYEWKCNSLNAPSRRAALRLGFRFEGVFRNHMVVKGQSRDTAWFAMTDDDWRQLAPRFDSWLAAARDGRTPPPLAQVLAAAG